MHADITKMDRMYQHRLFEALKSMTDPRFVARYQGNPERIRRGVRATNPEFRGLSDAAIDYAAMLTGLL